MEFISTRNISDRIKRLIFETDRLPSAGRRRGIFFVQSSRNDPGTPATEGYSSCKVARVSASVSRSPSTYCIPPRCRPWKCRKWRDAGCRIDFPNQSSSPLSNHRPKLRRSPTLARSSCNLEGKWLLPRTACKLFRVNLLTRSPSLSGLLKLNSVSIIRALSRDDFSIRNVGEFEIAFATLLKNISGAMDPLSFINLRFYARQINQYLHLSKFTREAINISNTSWKTL